MAAAKVAFRREHGSFQSQQAQVLAQNGVRKTNEHVDVLRVLNNRAYAALVADTTIGIAAYATLLSARITTLLANGFLIITFSASSVHITNLATTRFQILVDGVVTKGCYVTYPVAGYAASVSMIIRVPVRRGGHVVDVQWKTDNTSARINATSVVEEHAHLLVQEST